MSVSSLSLLSPVIRVSQNFWPRRPLNLVLSSSFLIFPSSFQLFLLPSSLRPQRASSFLSDTRSLPLSPLLPSQLSGFSSEKVSTRGRLRVDCIGRIVEDRARHHPRLVSWASKIE